MLVLSKKTKFLKDQVISQQQFIGQLQVESALSVNVPKFDTATSMAAVLIGDGSTIPTVSDVHVPEPPTLDALPPGAAPEQLWYHLLIHQTQNDRFLSSSMPHEVNTDRGALMIQSMLTQIHDSNATEANVATMSTISGPFESAIHGAKGANEVTCSNFFPASSELTY